MARWNIGKKNGFWKGVSVEDQAAADERIPLLLQTPAAVRFVSCEPLLAPVDLTWIADPNEGTDGVIDALRGQNWILRLDKDYSAPCPIDSREYTGQHYTKLDWVITGGESGPGARPCDVDWIRAIVQQCKAAGVPCFVKQLGANVFDSSLTASGRSESITYKNSKGGDPAEWPEDLRIRQMPEVTR